MKITVYFESNSHAEIVAIFNCEIAYLASLDGLKALARKNNMIVTESITL